MTLTLTLAPKSATMSAGSLPDFDVHVKNTGDEPQRFCAYMLRYRLHYAMTAMEEDGLELGLYPFTKGRWATFKRRDIAVIKPGRSIRIELALSKLESWAFFPMNDQPPMLVWKLRTAGIPKGTFEFKTSLLPRMAVYRGLNGAHDFDIETCDLPEQIRGLPSGKYADVFREDITASAQVTFA